MFIFVRVADPELFVPYASASRPSDAKVRIIFSQFLKVSGKSCIFCFLVRTMDDFAQNSIVDPNPHQIGKWDPDPHQSDTQDPDPHPQHWHKMFFLTKTPLCHRLGGCVLGIRIRDLDSD
jgi:hypothetical protein